MCASEENGFAVCVTYNPNILVRDSEYYHIEFVEIGFRDMAGQWKALHKEEGFNHVSETSVTLPPSVHEVERKLFVAVKYKSCSEVIYSDPWTVEQPALRESDILHAQIKLVSDP
jgi:hypothetical protein